MHTCLYIQTNIHIWAWPALFASYVTQATTAIFVPPKDSEGHIGRCRTANGGLGTVTIVSSSSVSDCKAQCAKRSECVAIEYKPRRRRQCEIHTETITHVSVKKKGDGIECWKKQARTLLATSLRQNA